jgi:serine/threonine protein kinase
MEIAMIELHSLLIPPPGLDRLELLTWLRADQLRRWQAGQRVPAEVYIQEISGLRDDPELAIDLIFSEFLLRRDFLADAPSLEEYLARFSEHAQVLRHQLELDLLGELAPRTQGRAARDPATVAAPPGASVWTEVERRTASTAPPDAVLLPGYEVLGELGRGGMGLVLRGRDLCLGRDLAVKLLHADYQGHPHLIRRFVNEARICGRLQHPGVVPVHTVGTLDDGRPYFTMKLVEGSTLADLLEQRRDPAQDWPRLLGVFEQVCQAVAYAHNKGVIHRDLKPGNVMVGEFGEVQVMDWGLAKVLGQDAETPSAEGSTFGGDPFTDHLLRTRSGQVVGTLPYMPPEQACGEVERIDKRSDVFGLGAILCEILTGRPPLTGDDAAALLARAKACDHAEALSALDRCGADGELKRLTRSCLAAKPSDRPQNAGEVAERMTAYLSGVQQRLRGRKSSVRRRRNARRENAGHDGEPGRRRAGRPRPSCSDAPILAYRSRTSRRA